MTNLDQRRLHRKNCYLRDCSSNVCFRNDYYGGPWASFNLQGVDKWIIQKQVIDMKCHIFIIHVTFMKLSSCLQRHYNPDYKHLNNFYCLTKKTLDIIWISSACLITPLFGLSELAKHFISGDFFYFLWRSCLTHFSYNALCGRQLK